MAKKKAAKKKPAVAKTEETTPVAEAETMPVAEVNTDSAWDAMANTDEVTLPPEEAVKPPDPPQLVVPKFEEAAPIGAEPVVSESILMPDSVVSGQGYERMLRESQDKPTDRVKVLIQREGLRTPVAEAAAKIGIEISGFVLKPKQPVEVLMRRVVE
jgi:hypothetical protein